MHTLQEIKDIVRNAKNYQKEFRTSKKLVETMFTDADQRARYLNGMAKRGIDEVFASMIKDQIVDIKFEEDDTNYISSIGVLILNKNQIEQLETAIDWLLQAERRKEET